MFETIFNKMKPSCQPRVLEQAIQLAVEIAREGREGRKIGAIFMLGDEDATLKQSFPFILDPLKGHSPEEKQLSDFNMRETAKELAQLDGAFIISNDGIFLSAARCLTADSTGINLPLGFGARHIAAAAMTRNTQSVAVVVSLSSIVRIFYQGVIVAEIIPEIWMLGRESIQIERPYEERRIAGLRIFATELSKDTEMANRDYS